MSAHDQCRYARRNMTLADMINLIVNDPAIECDRHRWRTAIEGLARGIGKPPATLPADPRRLMPLLSKASGARHRAGVGKGTWTTYKAQYRAATRHVGLAKGPARIDTPRSPAWRDLLAARTRGERNYLSRFAGVMTQQNVEPTEVTEAHFEAYHDYVRTAAVRDPEQAYHGACTAWRRVLDDNPAFPRCSPARSYRRPSYWRPWSEFPPELEATIDAYYEGQTRARSVDLKSLFKPSPSGSGRGIRRTTTRSYKNYLRALASAAVATGIPAESLTSLDSLLLPEVYEPAAEYLLNRRGEDQKHRGTTTSDDVSIENKYVYNILHHVRTVLKRHFGCSDERISGINAALRTLAPDNRMSSHTRQRIAVLREPRLFRQLFLLPERLYAELARIEDPTEQHAWQAAAVLLLAIDLDTAFRRSNAIKLSAKNFGPIDRTTGRMLVEIPPEDAKTEQPYMAELRPRTVALLRTFGERWRPLLAYNDLPYLFPVEGLDDERQEQRALAGFAGRLCRLVTRRLDVAFNLHVLRGLLASLYAEANPGDVLTVQMKLGHASSRTTERNYIDVRQMEANRRFDAVVDRLVRDGRAPQAVALREDVLNVF
jgi:integrase